MFQGLSSEDGDRGHQKLYDCSRCFDRFLLPEQKELHEKDCKTIRFECDQCDFVTLIKHSMERHRREHLEEKPYKCEHCSKRFTQFAYLTSHLPTHAKQFPFNCSRCFIGFSLESQKNEHEIWCNRNGYKCATCGYVTLNKKDITRHKRKHTKEKPNHCDQCDRGFTNLIALKEHRKVHVNDFSIHCSRCFDGFRMQEEKDEHQKDCKFNRYNCDQCDYFTLIQNHIKRHLQIHKREKAKKNLSKNKFNDAHKLSNISLPQKATQKDSLSIDINQLAFGGSKTMPSGFYSIIPTPGPYTSTNSLEPMTNNTTFEATAISTPKLQFNQPPVFSSKQSNELAKIDRTEYNRFNIYFNDSL
ncbi:zinc finger protein 239-like [Contarinia nasturtii]|uniref:zinc finger protein 239-like n=1 Tax=Contarinia nasturtii TaxID=265458 RepID=UPI0012D41C4D|nr:zinc finger protein 239-like [Contarinia nasturtii]